MTAGYHLFGLILFYISSSFNICSILAYVETQIIILAALMNQWKMVILSSTCLVFMAIFHVFRLAI